MSIERIKDIALMLYEALDTPHSLARAIELKNGEWGSLSKSRVDPLSYLDPVSYRSDVYADAFLRKCVDMPSSVDTRLVCIEKWKEAEHQCFRSNRYINQVLDWEQSTPFYLFLEKVRKNIQVMLGRPSYHFIDKFGKGSTFQHKGLRYTIPDKLSKTPELTADAWVHLGSWVNTAWARSLNGSLFSGVAGNHSIDLSVVRGNRFSTVPKTNQTDRPIGIEPTLNGFVQLGIGTMMRDKLRQNKLLLPESQDIHRSLARKGSVDGSLATIDLSSASDTVSLALVRAVMPFEWFDLLSSVRCSHTFIEGHWVRLEKFSSMGNGYTFELETTIFAAIIQTIAHECGVELTPGVNFSVYGDDIIVPTEIAKIVCLGLRSCGFSLNSEKTYLSGHFRESCGGDFFDGRNVRPIFVKKVPSEPLEWYSLHNQVNSLLHPEARSRLSELVIEAIPRDIRYFGPKELGDIVLHTDDVHLMTRRRDRHQLWWLKTLQPCGRPLPLTRWSVPTAVASLLYGVPSAGVIPRSSTLGYRKRWVSWG